MAIQDIDLGTVIENGEDGDVARVAFTKVNENFDDLDVRVTALENLDIGTVTSVNDVQPIDGNVELTPADIGAATAAQGALADTAIQPSIFIPALDNKVDKVVGYQLSQEDFTTTLKTKLEDLDDAGFQGFYVDLATLQAAIPVGQDGWWAFIDVNSVTPIQVAVWSEVDIEWQVRPGGGGSITAEEVKTLYESNPDTNAFTDLEKTKLSGIESGAQVNVGTNISQGTRTGTTVDINSSTGTGAVLQGASSTEAGLMIAVDKSKLDSTEVFTSAEKTKLSVIEAGAQVNTVTSVSGRTGAITLTKGDVGLNNVDNTSDLNKPVSDATQAALNGKEATLTPGTNITIDRTNPSAPVISATGGSSTPYVSPQQIITSGGSLSLTHGLADKPKIIQAALICIVSDAGYSVGDELAVPTGVIWPGADANTTGVSIQPTVTNLLVRFAPRAGGVFFILNKSTGALSTITNGSWRLVLRAWV